VRTASQILTIDNVMKNRGPQALGNNSIQITTASTDPDMDIVKASIVQAGTVPRAIPEGITFLDQTGALVPFSSANAGGGNGAATATFAFITGNGPNVRHPTTLRWELTTQTKSIEVPFELHNLDLPVARPKPAN
jgi:hypothetical protein